MKKEKDILKALSIIKMKIERFKTLHGASLDDTGFYFLVAVVKDKKVIVDSIHFDCNEMGINVENFEKVAIHKKLLAKYKDKDKKDLASQKKRFKKQINK